MDVSMLFTKYMTVHVDSIPLVFTENYRPSVR